MSMVDNIITAVLIAGVFGAAGIIYLQSQTSMNIDRIQQKQLFFSHDNYEHDYETFLLLTEERSGKDLSTLISYSMYRRKDEIPYFDPLDSDATVNVPETVRDTLDKMFGDGNYYFEATQKVYDISVNFVIDGSPSIKAERDELRTHLIDILEDALSQVPNVLVNIYILSSDDNVCGAEGWNIPITILENDYGITARCYSIHGEEQDDYFPVRAIYPTIYDSPHSLKNIYGISRPFNYAAKPTTDREAEYYYEADWAAGTAYSIERSENDAQTSVSIHFPLAGELNTGSHPQRCYIDSFTSDPRRVICELCEMSCRIDPNDDLTETEERAWENVLKATEMAYDLNHVIFPIFTWKTNFYSPDIDNENIIFWDAISEIYNNLGYGPHYPPPDGSPCQHDGCEGCSGNRRNVEFHPECYDEILRQLAHMADSTDGEVLLLNNPDEISTMVTNAASTFAEPYKIQIPQDVDAHQPGRERLVFEKKIPMPVGNEFITTRLHIFR